MFKKTFKFPESSFLSVEKDMSIIVDMIFKNESLKKMLYYTTKDCLQRPNLTDEQTVNMFGKQLIIVPKIYIESEVRNYILVRFNEFVPNPQNPEYRNNIIEFDIVCHYDQWHLKDFQLRPYRIAAELDTMFNNKRLTGIGETIFYEAKQIILTDEYGGVCVKYIAVHGNEDKINAPTTAEQERLVENFNKMFNNSDDEWILDQL